MRRGSDTSIDIAAHDLDANIVEKVYVNINQLGVSMKKEATLNGGIAHIELTGQETKRMAAGPIFLQIEAVTKDNKTIQSSQIRYSISGTLSDTGGVTFAESSNGFNA